MMNCPVFFCYGCLWQPHNLHYDTMVENEGTNSTKRSRDESSTARQGKRSKLNTAAPFSAERTTVHMGEKFPMKRDTEHLAHGAKNEAITTELFQDRNPGILTVGCDVMAQVLAFLEPPEVLSVLTSPLSRNWQNAYCHQPEMWRTLCIAEPFKAQVEDDNGQSKSCFYKVKDTGEVWPCEKFRMLYTSFVRCVKYLKHVQPNAINGDVSASSTLGRSREAKRNNSGTNAVAMMTRTGTCSRANGLRTKRQRISRKTSGQARMRCASSIITRRLLLPTSDGETSHTNLPWSCVAQTQILPLGLPK